MHNNKSIFYCHIHLLVARGKRNYEKKYCVTLSIKKKKNILGIRNHFDGTLQSRDGSLMELTNKQSIVVPSLYRRSALCIAEILHSRADKVGFLNGESWIRHANICFYFDMIPRIFARAQKGRSTRVLYSADRVRRLFLITLKEVVLIFVARPARAMRVWYDAFHSELRASELGPLEN